MRAMGGYTTSGYWRAQQRFKIAIALAILGHALLAMLGSVFYSLNEQHGARIVAPKVFTVKLTKEREPLPKLEFEDAEPTINNTPADTKIESLTKQPKSSDLTEEQKSSTISMDLVREFARNEAKTHAAANPADVEAFKQSFVEVVKQSPPSFSATVSPSGMVDVHTKLFGKDVCYLFDASSSPTENFDIYTASIAFPYKCKEANTFEFEMR